MRLLHRASADFLPVAFVLGLAPGRATEVPIVIVAEDGVTSLRYYLNIFRALPPAGSGRDSSASAWPLGDDASSGIAGSPAASLDLLHSAGDDWEGMPSVMPSAAMSARTARQPGAVLIATCVRASGQAERAGVCTCCQMASCGILQDQLGTWPGKIGCRLSRQAMCPCSVVGDCKVGLAGARLHQCLHR